MEKFRLIAYTNLTGEGFSTSPFDSNADKYKEIVITDSNLLNQFSSFDERISVSENDKVDFSFQIIERPNGELNPFISLVFNQAVLGLAIDSIESHSDTYDGYPGTFYLLKVVDMTPSFKDNNVVYTVRCQDYAGHVLAKQGSGLSYEYTGSLREISEGILGVARKNNLYKNLNVDIAKLSLRNLVSRNKLGFDYQLPYINFKSTSMSIFVNEPKHSYAEFIVTDKYVKGTKYDLHFDIVGMNRTVDLTEPFSAMFQVVGVNSVGREVFAGEIIKSPFTGTPIPIRIPFTYTGADYIQLRILKDVDNPWPSTGDFSISLVNMKISRNKEETEKGMHNELTLIHLDNFKEQFVTNYGSHFSETKMSYKIENSNIYNAFVSAATLFNAEVKFDYIRNGVYFVSKDHRFSRGYRLDPRVNLSSLSRPEKSNDLATVLHVQGGGEVDSAMPGLPKEWRMFLDECAANKYSKDEWFKEYKEGYHYKDFIPKVSSYILDSDSKEERNNEIKKFAEQMDKIPNFEGTLYNFSYFKEQNALTDYDYRELLNIIYNDIRKTNMELNSKTYNYYTIYSKQSSQLLQISFFISAINTERMFQYNSYQKLSAADAPAKYTSSWVSYMNQIDASLAAEINFTRELEKLLGLIDYGTIDLSPGSFVYNTLMIFGYKDRKENGIKKLLDENKEKKDKKFEEQIALLKKIEQMEEQINDPSESAFVKDSLQVELAGARRDLDNTYRYLGNQASSPDSMYYMPGIYVLETIYYEKLLDALENVDNVPDYFEKMEGSLYDYVINRESPLNLVNKKEEYLEIISNKYEAFVLEARYQNEDEVTPYGLLDQALKAFTTISYPQASYSVGAINIDSLMGVKSHPLVGDKIELDGRFKHINEDREESEILVVTGYTQNLRDSSSLDLSIIQDRDEDILVARMLQQTNFLKIGEGRGVTNLSVEIPSDLEKEQSNILKSIKELRESELSVSSLYDDMIK